MRWLANMRQSTALPGTPDRLAHIGDRESDSDELFCAADKLGTHFPVRTCVDRLAVDGRRMVAAEMAGVPAAGMRRIEAAAEDGSVSEAELERRDACIHVLLPPLGKQKRCPALDLTIRHASAAAGPRGRARINGKLAADLPIASVDEAVAKRRWHACRWKIEPFRKVLKSGCRAEAARLRTAGRLTKRIAVLSVIAWRCFWTAMIARAAPQGPAEVALTPAEIDAPDRVGRDRADPPRIKTLSVHLAKLARLGGCLARTRDPPPGNIVMRRGWPRPAGIMTGAELANRQGG